MRAWAIQNVLRLHHGKSQARDGTHGEDVAGDPLSPEPI